MRSSRVLLTCLALAGIATPGHADPAANGTRDAQRLVNCMKAFDTPCTAELTYTRFLEERGATRAKLIEAAENLNRRLKSVGAKYTRFDLDEAWKPFTGDGRVYVFIPYLQVLEAGGHTGTVKAYFIGISENGGSSWRFVDGVNASPENIRMIIPSYSGEPLPPKSIEPPGAPR